MSDNGELLLSLRDVERDHLGLRPLRVRAFDVRPRETIAILGLDRATAEAFVNLASAATLPEAGEVVTLGRPTSTITTNEEWVGVLDAVGILSERSLLLGEMTTAQNLAMPFSLDVFEMKDDLRGRVEGLAREVGLPAEVLPVPVAGLPLLMRARVRLARAIAVSPRLLLAEHPNALVEPAEVGAFAEDLARVIAARKLAAVVLTADRTFAKAVARSVLVHNPATGESTPASTWRRWWGRPW